jgi:hypothetical protein
MFVSIDAAMVSQLVTLKVVERLQVGKASTQRRHNYHYISYNFIYIFDSSRDIPMHQASRAASGSVLQNSFTTAVQQQQQQQQQRQAQQ